MFRDLHRRLHRGRDSRPHRGDARLSSRLVAHYKQALDRLHEPSRAVRRVAAINATGGAATHKRPGSEGPSATAGGFCGQSTSNLDIVEERSLPPVTTKSKGICDFSGKFAADVSGGHDGLALQRGARRWTSSRSSRVGHTSRAGRAHPRRRGRPVRGSHVLLRGRRRRGAAGSASDRARRLVAAGAGDCSTKRQFPRATSRPGSPTRGLVRVLLPESSRSGGGVYSARDGAEVYSPRNSVKFTARGTAALESTVRAANRSSAPRCRSLPRLRDSANQRRRGSYSHG
jgi:hypothetical protein